MRASVLIVAASRSLIVRPINTGVTDDEDPLIDTPLRGGCQMRQRIELRGGLGESTRGIADGCDPH